MASTSEPIHGFITVSVEPVPDYNGDAYLMRHELSGAELLFLANDDAEKAFAIAFKTLPQDDTGVFHIIEHSTLCGSRKYPVKDPFVHLLKTSMKTYLNAATGQTYTYYPVATTNEKDLFNLADVYLDAVFHPALLYDEAIFLQEGWHYEVSGEDIATTGVVLNEMRGYTSPEGDLGIALKRALFAGTPYEYVSGGEPGSIEQLTYRQFVETHQRCYRPDNCRITVYGDVDKDRMLAFLDAHLRGAIPEAAPGDGGGIGVAPIADGQLEQSRSAGSRLADMRDYALSPAAEGNVVVEGDITPERCMCQYWSVVSDSSDPDRTVACMVLADQLFMSDEAPVKRRVLESGVCNQMVGMVSADAFHPTLRVAMLGTQPGSAQACRDALLEAVREVLDEGLSQELVEAGIAQMEFRLKSHDFGTTPDGIMFIQDSMAGWLAFEDRPTGFAQYTRCIDFLRSKLGTDYFQNLLEGMFFGNDHVVFGELRPPAPSEEAPAADEAAQPVEAECARELAKRATDLLDARAQAMEKAPLDVLPRLTRDDLGSERTLIEPTMHQMDDRQYLVHHVNSNGIVYVTRVFDISDLPTDEVFYLSLLCSLLDKVATKSFTAEQMEIQRKKTLGKLGLDLGFKDPYEGGHPVAVLQLSASMLSEKVEDAVRLIGELLFEADYSDLNKLRLTVEQTLQALRLSFAHGRMAMPTIREYAAAHLSAASRLSDMTDGVEFYQRLEGLAGRLGDESALADLAERIAKLAKRVFGSCPEITSFTGTEEDLVRYHACEGEWRRFREGQLAWGALVHDDDDGEVLRVRDVASLPLGDVALALPVEVACNVVVGDLGRQKPMDMGAWMLADELVNLNYLWPVVREKGGAYGSRMSAQISGVTMLLSHDDPRIDDTFEAFADVANWLQTASISEEDFEGAVISSTAKIDKVHRVPIRVSAQLSRFLSGVPYDINQQARRMLLKCTRDDIAACGRELEQALSRVVRCACASPAQLATSSIAFETTDLLHITEAKA